MYLQKLESALWGNTRLTETFINQGRQAAGSQIERLAISRHRTMSKLVCTWPRFHHSTKRFYGILRKRLHPDHFSLIVRVQDVFQQDGHYRLDIFIDNRSGEADQVAASLQEQLPQRWHTRPHVPYVSAKLDVWDLADLAVDTISRWVLQRQPGI